MTSPVDAVAALAVAGSESVIAGLTSALEPICGVAIAVNVAYLGLSRFRHLKEISEEAKKELHIFNGGETSFDALPQNIKDMKPYIVLDDLCKFDVKYDKVKIDDVLDKGVWAWVFRNIYRPQNDRRASIFFTIISSFVLLCGVAFKIEIWNFFEFLFNKNYIHLWFYAVLFSGIIPVVFGFFGAEVVENRRQQAKHCREQIELAIQAKGQSVKLPDVIAPHLTEKSYIS